MTNFRVTLFDGRTRIVKAVSALNAAIEACNHYGVRYAETRLKILPINRLSTLWWQNGRIKGDTVNVDNQKSVQE